MDKESGSDEANLSRHKMTAERKRGTAAIDEEDDRLKGKIQK